MHKIPSKRNKTDIQLVISRKAIRWPSAVCLTWRRSTAWGIQGSAFSSSVNTEEASTKAYESQPLKIYIDIREKAWDFVHNTVDIRDRNRIRNKTQVRNRISLPWPCVQQSRKHNSKMAQRPNNLLGGIGPWLVDRLYVGQTVKTFAIQVGGVASTLIVVGWEGTRRG